MKFPKLISLIIISALATQIHCQTLLNKDSTIQIKTALFDFFVKRNLQAKQCEGDVALANKEIEALHKQNNQCDSVNNSLREIQQIQQKEQALSSQTLTNTQEQLSQEKKQVKKTRFILFGSALLEVVGITYLWTKYH